MSRRRSRRDVGGLEPGINLTPMLDMIFNLIFFFILATQIRQDMGQMDVQLPASGSSTAIQPKEAPPPVVTLTDDGQIFLNGQAMVEEELELYLFNLAGKGKKELSVHGDKRVSLERVIRVMDFCRKAGMQAIMLDTIPIEEQGKSK